MALSRFLLMRYLTGASVTASDAASGFAAANVLNDDRTQLWRSTGSESAYLDFDLGEEKPVNRVAVANHSLAYGGVFTLAGGSAAGGNDLFEQEYDAWEPQWSIDELRIDSQSIDGFPGKDELDRLYPAGSLCYLDIDNTMVRYLRLTMTGPTWESELNPDGKIQAGLVAPGQYFESDVAPQGGLGMGPDEKADLDYSEGGQVLKDPGPRFRTGSYTYDYTDEGMAAGAWYDFLQEVGVGGSFFADFFPDAESPALRMRSQLLCHLTKLDKIKLKASPHGQVKLDIRETT